MLASDYCSFMKHYVKLLSHIKSHLILNWILGFKMLLAHVMRSAKQKKPSDQFICSERQVQIHAGYLFVRSSENVCTSAFTRRPHRLHRRSPQQVGD